MELEHKRSHGWNSSTVNVVERCGCGSEASEWFIAPPVRQRRLIFHFSGGESAGRV